MEISREAMLIEWKLNIIKIPYKLQTSQGPLFLLQLIFVQTKYSIKKLYNNKITNC